MSCIAVEMDFLNRKNPVAYDLSSQSGIPGRHIDNINNFCEAEVRSANVNALCTSEIKPLMIRALTPNANDQSITFPVQRKDWKKNLRNNMIGLKGKKVR